MYNKRYFKKPLAFLLALIMCISLLPSAAFADEEPGEPSSAEIPAATESGERKAEAETEEFLPQAADNRPLISLEWEKGQFTNGTSGAVVVNSDSAFSGGKFVDSFDKSGPGAAVEVDPQITEATAGKYKATFYYAKGTASSTGDIPFYQNDARIGVFHIVKGGLSTVVASTTGFDLDLAVGDKLSIRCEADGYSAANYYGRYDRLLLTPISSGTPDDTRHTVTLTVNDPKMGTLKVTRANGAQVDSGEQVVEGTKLSIQAIPGGNEYQLEALTANGTDIKATGQWTITGETTIAATFKAVPVERTIKLVCSDPEGGTLIVTKPEDSSPVSDGDKLLSGTKIKAVTTLNPGYTLKSLNLVTYDSKGKLDEKFAMNDGGEFTLPATKETSVTIYAVFAPWSGKFDAAKAELLPGDYKGESGVKMPTKRNFTYANVTYTLVEGFSKGMNEATEVYKNSGVKFRNLGLPDPGTYQLIVSYTRGGDYDQTVKPSLYVGDTYMQTIDLPGTINAETLYQTPAIELELEPGDTISIKLDDNSEIKGQFALANIVLLPKPYMAEPDTAPRFESNLVMVAVGAEFNLPTVNLPEDATLTYESSKTDIATIDESTGEVTAVAAGETVITATVTGGDAFSTTIQVKATAAELNPETKKTEAESAMLIGGEDTPLAIVSNAKFSGGKYVENFWDQGPNSAVRFKNVVDKDGDYRIWMRYAKGVSYSPCTLTLYVNNNRIDKFHMSQTPSLDAPVDSNSVIVHLNAGDSITIKRDPDDAPLTRFDYLGLEQVAAIPASDFTIHDITIKETEISEVPFAARTPAGANDIMDWHSDDEDVVQVNNGSLFAGAPGEATVTVTSRYFDKSTSFKVTVEKNNDLVTLKSDALSVILDKAFPRVIKYKLASGKTMDGNFTPIEKLVLTSRGADGKMTNKEYRPEVTFTEIDAASATYDLKLTNPNATIRMSARVEGNVFKLEVIGVDEEPGDQNRVFGIEIPGLNLISATNQDQGAQFAGANITTDVRKSSDTFLDLNQHSLTDTKPLPYAYTFLTNGKVAAGLAGNGMLSDDNSSSIGSDHFTKQTKAEGTTLRTSLSGTTWIYRRSDYYKTFQDLRDKYPEEQDVSKIVDKVYKMDPEEQKPYIWVVVTEECNGDDVLNWQDAAYAYRPLRNRVFDDEKIPDLVVQRLIMQQAGVGNYPFTAVLDETKRVSLNTDNLGQMILDKFHNEGYWGDFTHYDDHLGGWRDFNNMVDEATTKYNGYVGVHSNFTEYFAKAEQFSTELTDKLKDGGVHAENNGYKAFGAFLQQAYTIDDIADSVSGDRRERLTTFKQDVPNLGFVYSDVWSKGNWRGRRAGEDYRAADIGYMVEWPYINFEDSPWAHWGVEKGYGGMSLKGITSDIMRFVWNDRDRWDNDAFSDEPDRVANARNLLMGADTTNWEGWWNNGRTHRYDRVIFQIFDTNLPTKFMQHFPIMSMKLDDEGWAENVVFENGVRAYHKDGNVKDRVITIDGKVVYEDNTYLLPWDDGHLAEKEPYESSTADYRPGENSDLAAQRITMTTDPTKLYFWSAKNGDETVKDIADTTWDLPDGWSSAAKVYLYKLTDIGRVEEREIPVTNGKITLTGMKSATPYVVYKERQATSAEQIEEIELGDGGLVRDPGFSAGVLAPSWTLDQGQAEVMRNYTVGDTTTATNRYQGLNRLYELVMQGADESQVSQIITGLIPGESYAATVMVEIQQDRERKATLAVDCGGITVQNYATQSILINANSYDSKADTYMLRMRVQFTVPEGVTTARLRLIAAADDSATPAIVRFDNVRVFECTIKEATVTEHADGSVVTGKIIAYQDWENTPRNPDLIQGTTDAQRERDALKPEFEAYAPMLFGPSQLSGNTSAERRSSITSRHDPYTQNGLIGSQWDDNSLAVDDALVGDRSLRLYAASEGVGFQTIPQSVRFEAGRTYKVSFLYQYRKDAEGDFEFVVGEGEIPLTNAASHDPNSSNIKKHVPLSATSPAISEETRCGKFVYVFTAANDQTWVGINKRASKGDEESPNPFQLDNFLVEDVSSAEHTVYLNAGAGGILTVKSGETALKDGDKVPTGTVLTITSTAKSGYLTGGITVNGEVLTEDTVTVTGDITINAAFIADATMDYTVTLTVNEGGTLAAATADGSAIVSGSKVAGGTELTIIATANSDYALERITVNGEILAGTTAIIAADTVIAATFKSIKTPDPGPGDSYTPPTTVTETRQNEDGSVTKTVTDKKTGTVTVTTTWADGTKVTTTTTKDGAIASEVTVPENKGSVTVTIPVKETTPGTVAVIVRTDGSKEVVKTSVATEGGIRVTLTEGAKLEVIDNSKTFADVADDHWANRAVQFAASRELFNGTAEEAFSPELPMSRAMLVTVLARLDGQDTSKGKTWDSMGNAWGKEHGITDGANPTGNITREQLAVMLYRYVKSGKTETDMTKFADVNQVNDWASEAMAWAVANGILTGKTGDLLDPQGTATRAEVAAMIKRFAENL